MAASSLAFIIAVVSSFTLSYGSYVIVQQVKTCNGQKGKVVDISDISVRSSGIDGWGVSGNVSILRNIPDQATVSGTVYKHLFTWVPLVPFPQMNVCKFVQSDNFVWRMIVDHSNLPKKCPYKKGEYTIEDAVVGKKYVPWFVPKGCFKVNIKISVKSKTISCFDIIGDVSGKKVSGKNCVS